MSSQSEIHLTMAIAEGVMVLEAFVLLAMPRWSSRGVFFGKSCVPDFAKTDEGRTLLSRYRLRVALVALASIVATHAFLMAHVWAGVAMTNLLLWLGTTAAWIAAYRRMPPVVRERTALRTASLEIRDRGLPGGFLSLGPFAILALAAMMLYVKWDAIPDRFATHWGLDGEPNGWASRTLSDVFLPLIIATAQTVVLTVLAFLITSRTRQVHPTGLAAARESRVRTWSASTLVALSYVLSIIFAFIATRPLWSDARDALSPAVIALPILSILVMVTFMIVVLVRQQRALQMVADEGIEPGDGTPDECWKWGLFYYNANDPSLLVPKRVGIGWTMNFAHKGSWAFLALPLLAPVVIAVVLLFSR